MPDQQQGGDPILQAALMGGRPPGATPMTPGAPPAPGGFSQFPGAAQPTAPTQGMGGADLQQILAQRLQQLPSMAGPFAKLNTNLGQQEDVIRQYQALQQPKTGPSIDPHAGILHNIGQALLMAAGITGPGRALEHQMYAPGVRSYEMKSKALADQLAGLRGAAEVPERELQAQGQALGGAAMGIYRGGMLDVQGERNRIRQQAVDQQAQRIAAETVHWQRSDQYKALSQQEKVRFDNMWNQVNTQRNDIAQQAVDKGYDLGQTDAYVRAQIANNQAYLGMVREFPWFSIGQAGGLPATPEVEAPPVRGAAGPPAKPGAKGKIRVQLQNGQTGSIDPSEFDPKTMKKLGPK
jgi:hypothetical protein